jgi:hypothetical protein
MRGLDYDQMGLSQTGVHNTYAGTATIEMSWWSDTTYRNTERGIETDFIDKLVHASFANNYNYDGSGSLPSTAQSKSNYLKILKVQDFKIELRLFPLNLT